jgi:hypothetical protein
MKIIESIFGMDGTFIRLETDKGKIYIHKGKFWDVHPGNCFAKVLPEKISKEVQEAVNRGGYNLVNEVKSFIKELK